MTQYGFYFDATRCTGCHSGCTNTLTSRQRNPVSKGTGQHSVIGTIEKVKE